MTHFITRSTEDLEDRGFEITGTISSDTLKIVRKVRHRRSNMEFAIKAQVIARANRRDDFNTILDDLRHPNLLSFLKRYEDVNILFTWMELYMGLDEYISSRFLYNNPVERFDVITIMSDILEGLTYLHINGITHRCIQPRKIFLQKGSPVKAIIGGLTRAKTFPVLDQDEERPFGFYTYCAPEQLMNLPQIYNEKVDIYSCGYIFFELIYKMPQEEVNDRFMDLEMNEFPDDLGNEWAEKANIIGRMMSNNPINRPDAASLLELPSLKLGTPDTLIEGGVTVD